MWLNKALKFLEENVLDFLYKLEAGKDLFC